MAAMYGSSCGMSTSSGVDGLEGGFDVGERAVEREADGLLHLLPHRRGDRVGLVGRQTAVGDEPAAERRHRVAALRRLVLLGRPELLDRLVLREVERHA